MSTIVETRDKIIKWAKEKKAEDIVSIDVKGKSSYTDMLIICSGSNDLHVKAIANNITENVKKEKIGLLASEGMKNASWVLIDLIDIVVHVFNENSRKYYKLEELWDINSKTQNEMINDDKE